MVYLGLGGRRILLSSLNHGQVLLREHINDNLVRLFSLQGRYEHLDKNVELFEITGLVSYLFYILLFVITSPDQPLHF